MDSSLDYIKVQIKSFPSAGVRETAEGRYWRRFRAPRTTQQIGVVSCVDYSSVYPHDFAVTSSTRVLIYDGITHRLKKTISRFPDIAYSGRYRVDGKVLVAGCESGIVQVFDLTSRSILRQFRAHQRPTHVTHFSHDKTHVLSGSDDATVRWWDLAAGEQVMRFDGHKDYVRAAASCAAHSELWLTGSYDHTCLLWDVRTGESTMTLEHGAPVESVAFFPAGGLVATAGGTSVCLWDVVGGGRLLQRLTNHQKTVTCVSVVDVKDADSHASSRLLTGSADGHVKVYDLDTFKVAYACKYPSPVLSVAVAPNLSCMTVGLADRTMVVRKHKNATSTLSPIGAGGVRLTKKQRSYAPRLTAATYKYFLRGQSAKASASDYVVSARRRAKLREFDTLLKQFRYADALDSALKTGRADVVASVLEELATRSGLASALANRAAPELLVLLQHTCKYVTHPHHARMMLHVLNHILDAHAHLVDNDDEVGALLEQLRSRVIAEVKVQQDLRKLQGSLDLLLNSPYVT